MPQTVITTARRYVDIDGLACVIAYRELVAGSQAVIPGPLNQSVTSTIRRWPLNYLTSPNGHDFEFVIMDVSEEKELPIFVKKNQVIKIFDHHFGFAKDWQHLGQNCHIEPVGACATLIWEAYKEKWECEVRNGSGNEGEKLENLDPLPISHPHPISTLSANLLYTAIVSNTLNFKASITTARDKQAFAELKTRIDLPDNWISRYYLDQEADIYLDPIAAITNDTKVQTIKGLPCAIGQIELWDSRDFIKEHKSDIETALRSFGTETWLFTSPCISEGRNYIFTRNQILKDYLGQVLQIDFFGTDVGVTKKLWLRKEILKKIQ